MGETFRKIQIIQVLLSTGRSWSFKEGKKRKIWSLLTLCCHQCGPSRQLCFETCYIFAPYMLNSGDCCQFPLNLVPRTRVERARPHAIHEEPKRLWSLKSSKKEIIVQEVETLVTERGQCESIWLLSSSFVEKKKAMGSPSSLMLGWLPRGAQDSQFYGSWHLSGVCGGSQQ